MNNVDITLCLLANFFADSYPNAQVSDTTGDATSATARTINKKTGSWKEPCYIITKPTLTMSLYL